MIGVVIVEDHTLVRAGFRLLLEAEEEMTVEDEAGDADQAVRLARLHKPDAELSLDESIAIADSPEVCRRWSYRSSTASPSPTSRRCSSLALADGVGVTGSDQVKP
ncbi:MAG: hypothetical protein ABSB24_18735 [Gaiellaceae bacterium]